MHGCILWFSFVLWTRKSACQHKSWISWVFFNKKKSFNYLLGVTISDIHYDLSFTITACHRHISNFSRPAVLQLFWHIIFLLWFNWNRQTLLLVYQTHKCLFLVVSLRSSLRNFTIATTTWLVVCGISVSEMTTDMSVDRNHNTVLSLFITYYRVFEKE